MKVHVAVDLLVQKVQDGVRLGLGHADDAAGEPGIDVDALPAGDGVDADDGMDCLDGLATHVDSGGASAVCLSYGAVEGCEALQVGLQPRAKGRVQCIAVYDGVRQHYHLSH